MRDAPAMKMTPLRIGLIAVLLFVAVSVLGGSAIWQLGGRRELDMSGRAAPEVEADSIMGRGWESYGCDMAGTRYSRANQITAENVTQLAVAWTFNTGAFEGRESARERSAFEATPILIENRSLVFCTQFNDVI